MCTQYHDYRHEESQPQGGWANYTPSIFAVLKALWHALSHLALMVGMDRHWEPTPHVDKMNLLLKSCISSPMPGMAEGRTKAGVVYRLVC